MGYKEAAKAAAVTSYVIGSSLLGQPQPSKVADALFELNQTQQKMEVRPVAKPSYSHQAPPAKK